MDLDKYSRKQPTNLMCPGFFAILHSWLNAFAEMLRFADRLFYKVRATVIVHEFVHALLNLSIV